jgi:hypothetical protein
MRWLAGVLLVVACGGSSEVIPDSGACVADQTPPGGACPAVCTSCDGGICKIDCGSAGCNDRTLNCPSEFACEITCNGLDACDTTVVECPELYACSMTCTAYDACGDVTLHCGLGTCSMTCNGPTESCGGSTIDCAPGTPCSAVCNGSQGPSLDCRGACSCTPC